LAFAKHPTVFFLSFLAYMTALPGATVSSPLIFDPLTLFSPRVAGSPSGALSWIREDPEQGAFFRT